MFLDFQSSKYLESPLDHFPNNNHDVKGCTAPGDDEYMYWVGSQSPHFSLMLGTKGTDCLKQSAIHSSFLEQTFLCAYSRNDYSFPYRYQACLTFSVTNDTLLTVCTLPTVLL